MPVDDERRHLIPERVWAPVCAMLLLDHAVADGRGSSGSMEHARSPLGERKYSRMDSNHRFLGVGQESLPLDHRNGVRGKVLPREWSDRELHPNFRFARPMSSCWTIVQSDCRVRSAAEAVGLEPTSEASSPPVFETGPSSGRMTSVLTDWRTIAAGELRGLGSNQHHDVQSVASCR